MQETTKLGTLLLTSFLFASSALAGTLTNITFESNVFYQNDTVQNGTSPIGFTLIGSTVNPFLNDSNSFISLDYGSYFAITSGAPFGRHLGAGVVSFRLDDTTNYTQNVTFPDNTSAGVLIASFSLPGGDAVELLTTGIFADRVRIGGDANGLGLDQVADPFFLFNYTSGAVAGSPVPEPSSLALGLCGLGALAWYRRRK